MGKPVKVGRPPRLKFAAVEPLQDFYSDRDGNEYNVARLVDDTSHLKPFNCPIASLCLSDQIWRGADIWSLAFHCKKVMDADLTKPIILDWRGDIADGRHRVIKALCEGRTHILAVRMTWKPTPCRPAKEQ